MTKGKMASIYVVDRPAFDEFITLCRLEGKSASGRIKEMVRADIAHMKGEEVVEKFDYVKIKSRYARVVEDYESVTNRLEKQKVYSDLFALAKELGLDTKTYDNVDDVAPQLIQEWKGQKHYAFLFAGLMETVVEKRLLERQLAGLWENRTKN